MWSNSRGNRHPTSAAASAPRFRPATVVAVGMPQGHPRSSVSSVHSECVRVSGFPPLVKELHHMSFADLGVSRPVADALAKRGIVAPFPIQKLVVEDVLSGRDVLVQSPTGSGKTLAFGVPLIDRLEPG